MKNYFRHCVAGAALIALTAVLLVAADATGTWKAAPFEVDGNNIALTFNLKASGATLSGTIDGLATTATEIKDGKVDGDSISFWATTVYQDHPVKLVYKGKISGDRINLTMGTEDGSWSTDLVATRAT